jgi:5-methylcytosine-specific restriction endonuclease McrA
MDALKFLKASRELLEAKATDDNAKAREDAERAGGVEVRGRGKYYDKNNEFVGTVAKGKFIPKSQQDKPLKPRMAAGYTKSEPNIPEINRNRDDERSSVRDKLKQSKAEAEPEQDIPSVADQYAKVIPGGPDEKVFQSGDIEQIAKMMERGKPVTAKQHARYMVQAQRQLNLYNQQQAEMAAQAEAEAAAEAEQEIKDDEALAKEMGTPEGELKDPSEFKTLNQELEDAGKNVDGSLMQGDVDIATEESIGNVEVMANTDVEDQRFDKGRQSQKEFLDYYSQDSENREGLNTLNSVAKSRDKVDQMMEAVDNGDYLEEVEITKGNKKSVSELLLDAGIDVNDQAQIDCFKNAYKEVNNFIDGKGRFKTSESSELTGSNLGYYEAKHIEKRNDLKTLDPAGVQTKAYNLRNDAESNMQCVTPTITDAVYNLMPTAARTQLAKSGAPGEKNHYDPTKKNRKGTSNPIRGSAALHMWTMQDGKDAYAAAGRRRSPGEFQVEHVVPLKSGGKDEIENFTMLLKRVNEPRADLDFDKFLTQAKNKAADIDADLSNPKTRAKFEKKYRSSRYNDNFAPIMGGSVSGLVSDDVMNTVNKALEDNLSEKAAANLKVKPEDFKKYQQEVQGFLDKNGLGADDEVVDMTSNQINGVFDIMAENLGIDKSKMMEYMGRNTLNNYDVGGRTVINKETGELERGRSGTQSSSGNLTTMQNSIIADDSFEPEQKKEMLKTINDNHQEFKKARNTYIDNPNDPQAFEDYVGSMLNNIGYLTGDGDSPLSSDRKYDTRLTPSEKNTLDDDVLKGIIGMTTTDKGSLEKDKDVFSPGRQKKITPKAKEHVKALRKKMIDAYSRTSGLTPEQIENPDSLKAGDKKKLTTLTNALENFDAGLGL